MWPFHWSQYPERSAIDVHEKAFDYVIVGGGTAACVLASRLSEDPLVSVLLLCKGLVDDPYLYRIPLYAQALDGRVWQSTSVRSQLSPACPGTESCTPVCTALGGATRINGLTMTRSPPACFNQWADMGNDKWSWAEVEPYFCKFENAHCHSNASHRGHDGPLHLRHNPPPWIANEYYKKAAEAIGLPVKADYNDPQGPANGLFNMDQMIYPSGFRCSVYHAYLPKSVAVKRRSHLTICTRVVASKLDVDSNGVARGVHILDHLSKRTPKTYYVQAKREVIVCCGALYTPQLLMLSGIGPKDQLDLRGIPAQRHLSGVGANLQDHAAFGIAYHVLASDSLTILYSPLVALWHLLLFVILKVGLLASMSISLAIFVRSGAIDDKTMTVRACGDTHGETHDNMDASRVENVPDIEVMLVPGPTQFIVTKEALNGLLCSLSQPFSTGRIELASTDPLADPVVHHCLLQDPRDLAVARKATRFMMHYVERFRASGYSSPVKWSLVPGLKPDTAEGSWRDPTDEEIDAFVRQRARSIYHPTSSCRMAPESEAGVVGQDLKVHGFRNLRICDASVLPKIPSAHPMAAILMVAERCADFIKSEWASFVPVSQSHEGKQKSN